MHNNQSKQIRTRSLAVNTIACLVGVAVFKLVLWASLGAQSQPSEM